MARARFAGPSASLWSAVNCAPVKTTGFVMACCKWTSSEDSSIASVPCRTTIPATSGSSSSIRTASLMLCMSASVRLDESFAMRSTGFSRAPISGTSASRSSPERLGVLAPSAPRRLAMVPPVAMTATRGIAPCPLNAMLPRVQPQGDRCGHAADTSR